MGSVGPWVRGWSGSNFYVGYVGQNIFYVGHNFYVGCVDQIFLRMSIFFTWVKVFSLSQNLLQVSKCLCG